MSEGGPSHRVRPVVPADLDAIAAAEPELFGSQAWSRGVYAEEIERPDRCYLAVDVDGRLAGYAGVALDPEWTVMTIGVLPWAQRRGIARALLDALVDAARRAGGTELFLEVKAHDGGAQQLYRDAGFRLVGLRRRYYQPEGVDAVVMRLDLGGPTRRVGPVGAEAVAADPAGQREAARQREAAVDPFVDVAAAHDLIWSADPPVVLDVRWALGAPDGRAAYAAGHLPGAVFVDLETQLAAPAAPELGRHPLPEAAHLQASARAWGIDTGSTVLVYDDAGGTSAARAWWLLRWAGLDRVAIIDGGLRAWVDAGHHLEQGMIRPRPGNVVLRPGGLPTIDIDEAAAWTADGTGVLLDARAGERYRGEVEPVDPRAGHVPGATSAPTVQNLTEAGWLRERAELLDRFARLGVTPAAADAPRVAAYCGSGVTAAHTVAVLASLGIEAALFPGSWSQWSNDPARPVATGP